MNATAQQRARRQQKVEELCAATLRAMTGDPALHYRGRRLHQGSRPLPMHAPHLHVDPDLDDFADCRAAADGMALRLLHSDPALHRSLCPDSGIERLVFEWLEQLRVETHVPVDMPGMAANLQHRFEDWSRTFYREGLTEGRLGILLYTVAQMAWSRLNARPVLEETEDYIEGTRVSLVSSLGGPLAGMRRNRDVQAAFAQHALAAARVVGETVRADMAEAGVDADTRDPEDEEETKSRFALLLDFDPDEGEGDSIATAATGVSKVFADAEQNYHVYTTRFDTEVAAGTLVRKALLREYRERVDKRIAEQGINLPRLARMLGAILARPQRDGWLFGQEEGTIDGARLSQLISSPAERRLFRQDQYKPMADCMVTFLVDCSGSMKTHAEAVAAMIDVLIRALEMVGVTTELLGFTTGAWNGGRAFREWMSHGRPANPGRLNEVTHMVFKEADRNWRRSRVDMMALLKPDLFREGIDGEAVDWACNRMLARDEARRILIVISDGCPADSATGRANDDFYLDNHLKEVVARREQQGAVEILGLGVGLDLSPFYRRCLATDMSQALDNNMFFEIVQLIAGRHRR
ncbi:cobalt chelatase [Azoarcus sp. L1K30]|uniref:cobaltochelatase CobT-related protein n=1 Tax=Azoarcus sp. L1K30 TaxID=2820277 RepID=UPI001B84640F|nr:cobalt chelatase [Azoarcus sp. L1K30]MBR0565431.1 cobalt chelatase [Azoarcus sp. L1K30]